MHLIYILFTSLTFAAFSETKTLPCNAVKKKDGFICVCNATYCDTIETPEKLGLKEFHIFSTSNTLPGFNHRTGSFKIQAFSPHGLKLKIKNNAKRQTIMGFGGAFTDSFGSVFNSLDHGAQTNLLKSYFSQEGVEYTFCRVVFGNSDFSMRHYTYAPDEDPSLKSFNLTEDDYKYKIPIIQRANSISKRTINLMGATWATPTWMKRGKRFATDYLLPKYRQAWADYHVKSIDAFKKEGINFWGLSLGNEPITLLGYKFVGIENLAMLPEEQRDWLANNLEPAFNKAGYKNISYVILDDNRSYALWYMHTIMKNKKARKYTTGIGMHWYMDAAVSFKHLDEIHEKYPDKSIYYTETSINPYIGLLLEMENNTDPAQIDSREWEFPEVPPLLGSWRRAGLYITNIIETLSHWVTGYMDWNMALDLNGGPNMLNLSCDAPLVVNTTANEFYKQPIFYALGHFSKFLQPGAVILESEFEAPKMNTLEEQHIKAENTNSTNNYKIFEYKDVKYVAAINPDGSHSVIIYNPKHVAMDISFHDETRGHGFITLEPQSLTTVVY